MTTPHPYRTHTCGALSADNADQSVRLAGWVHRKRDHGQLLFIDLRDHYGITQCVMDVHHPLFRVAEHLSPESVITVAGAVVKRDSATVNPKLPTGTIEVVIETLEVLSTAQPLPFSIHGEGDFSEELRLRYRFLDLRRAVLHDHIVLRSQIITFLRHAMQERGFIEIQTPILTASSPEGARDYVVPSRLYPGEFYALPQAPQQFKQLLIASGFDKYFQIAPCFRDEAARADRAPGEFYQLDFEMAFATQEDVFSTIEPVLHAVFQQFGHPHALTSLPFPRIPYQEALLRYGTDKPDLRNPFIIQDATHILRTMSFGPFQTILDAGGVLRVLRVPGLANHPRRLLKEWGEWALAEGAPGLGYLLITDEGWQGPMVKFLSDEQRANLQALTGLAEGDGLFFICDHLAEATRFAGRLRTHIAEKLDLLHARDFQFCWIVDFPMYERNEETGQIDFSHNPFSMPQGGMEALLHTDPLQIKAYQYDIVCNGIELSSGAIRNHVPEIMYKAFEIAGYTRQHVEDQFGALLRAFHYGVPPHGGFAPGVDRIVMLLAGTPNIREVIAFPFNQQSRDLLMGAPSPLPESRWNELHLRPAPKKSTSSQLNF